MNLLKLNKVAASLILIANVYFIYGSIKMIITRGGPMGFGLVVLMLNFVAHLFIISAVIGIRQDKEVGLNILANALGFIYCLFLTYIYVGSMTG